MRTWRNITAPSLPSPASPRKPTTWRKFFRCTPKIRRRSRRAGKPPDFSEISTVIVKRCANAAGVLASRGWPSAPPTRRMAPAAYIAASAWAAVCTAASTMRPDTVTELRAEKNFTYQRDVIVTKLRETSEKVFIEGFHRETRAPLSFEAGRVYLAAGVIPTAQILLRSQAAYDHPLTLRDSQYFLFPIVLARRSRAVPAEALYTLSQLFIELNNPQISRRSVHLQVYTYSDLIAQTVRKSLGPLKMFARPLEERLVIVQGYLHSDESPGITMTLKRDGEKDFLQLDARPDDATRHTVKKVLRELLSQTRRLGGMVVPPMLQLAEPGRGFHCGGSIPMRESPKPFESDRLGRPQGWSRVHAVDASVLPSIPATTITFSVMANAHRIGWETAGGSFL